MLSYIQKLFISVIFSTFLVPKCEGQTSKTKVFLAQHSYSDHLEDIANKFGLQHDEEASTQLSFNGDVLEARYMEDSSVCVDFTSGQLKWRKNHGGGEAIARAVGVKSNYHPYVIDATGGFGTDAFVLSSLGCKVKLFEKHPLVASLLADGIRRASNELGDSFRENFLFEFGDSLTYLTQLSNGTLEGTLPDVIYLDPMFPKSKNSALVKKNIKFLQNVAPLSMPGEDEGLIRVALLCCRRRVVVKRPLDATWLGNLKTSNFVKSNRYRFDIYTSQHVIG